MATSDTFTGSRGGGSTGPYLTLNWRRTQTDVANNRSRIRLTLKLHANYRINFSASKTGKLHGESFTYTAGVSGTGSWTLHTRDVWVNHNSDGTKSQSFSASFNIGISWSGTKVNSLSVSGTANIDRIPRASSFTVSGNTLGSPIDVSINRASSSFTHEVIYDLPVGSRRAEWSGISTSKTFTPSLSDAKYLSSTATSGKGRITVNTYSGSTHIGTARKDFTLYIPDSVKPNISGLSTSISGSGHDKSIGKYVQNISKVYASFNSSALYGASISSRKITIKRRSDGGNSQTINSGSGTTSQPVSLSGEYEVQATVKDSRGRSNNTDPIYFDVHTYSPPRITQFTTVRRAGEQSTVDIVRQGSWSSLNGDNYIDISVDRQEESGWVNLESVRSNETGGIIKKTLTDTDRDTWSSYSYRFVVSDDFGNQASAESSVTTERVVLDINKNEGVGIGKMHEQGVLDVGGEAYFNGDLFVNNVNISSAQPLTDVIPTSQISDTVEFWRSLPQGTYFVYEWTIPNQPSQFGIFVHSTPMASSGKGTDVNTIWYSQPSGAIYRKSGDQNGVYDWYPIDRPETGSNSNGEWIRFNDGTQICWQIWKQSGMNSHSVGNGLWRSGHKRIEYAKSFIGIPSVTIDVPSDWQMWAVTNNSTSTNVRFVIWKAGSSIASTNTMDYIAVGRWK